MIVESHVSKTAKHGAPSGEPGYGTADSSMMKTVRVVTSVDYYLEK
jgi:hypothetical protein